MTEASEEQFADLLQFISPDARQLMTASGINLVRQIGLEVVRGVVYDVLTGKNLRDSTETLTRRRIAALNLALVGMFIKGAASQENFVENLPELATRILQKRRPTKNERWIAQWILGLTDKAFQNVLRDDPQAIVEYRRQYIETCARVIQETQQTLGDLTGRLELGANQGVEVNWLFLTYLLNTIGAETLTIRGSEKSAYGKLFERLILGTLLHILGFTLVPELLPGRLSRVFILSSRGERRESDATLFYEPGKAVRFDIGFIGRGNPEISLDKVSRFERELILAGSQWYVSTIIIVDRIGANSRISRLAESVGGTIVQMSMGYWPQQVARDLHRVLGYEHPLVNMDQAEIGEFLKKAMLQVPLEDIIRLTEV